MLQDSRARWNQPSAIWWPTRYRKRTLLSEAAAFHDGRAKPVCDWGDPDERAWLIDDLVTDAQRVLDALDGSELSDEQAQAAALLAVVAGQDVEADPKVPGRWRIARRVAKGRVISTVDPEARHARKSRSQRRTATRPTSAPSPTPGSSPQQNSPQRLRRPSRTPPAPTRPHSPPQHRRHRRHRRHRHRRHRHRHHRHHR